MRNPPLYLDGRVKHHIEGRSDRGRANMSFLVLARISVTFCNKCVKGSNFGQGERFLFSMPGKMPVVVQGSNQTVSHPHPRLQLICATHSRTFFILCVLLNKCVVIMVLQKLILIVWPRRFLFEFD